VFIYPDATNMMRLIIYLSATATAFAAAMAVDDTPSRVLAERDTTISATPAPSAPPKLKTHVSQGCFESKGELVDPKGYNEQQVSLGFCSDTVCKDSKVFAMKGSSCFCGSKYPPQNKQVEDEKCNYSCPAYPQDACTCLPWKEFGGGSWALSLTVVFLVGGGISGGKSYYAVYNTGIELDVPFSEDASPSETPSDTSAPVETVTQGSSGKSNVGGIAAGVVVGVLAIAGIGGGIFFYMKRKRNREIEEEHRRNAAVSGFMGHKPGSSGAISITDSRLDPGMVQRRLSDGSIADNQDYSRKILRVCDVARL
jgi:cell wall integrity and stress response component